MSNTDRDLLLETVDCYLQSRGYLDPSPESKQFPSLKSWVKKLDCGFWVTIKNRLYSGVPRVYIEVAYPLSGTGGVGKDALDGVYVSLLQGGWQNRLLSKLAAVSTKADEIAKIRCPHCGGYMAQRTVKKDGDLKGKKFWGCLSYPTCRGIRAEWKMKAAEDDGKFANLKCPECQAPMAVRYVKKECVNKGKRFFGCTRFPDCRRIVENEEAMALRMMQEPTDPVLGGTNPFGGLTQ